MDPHVVARTLLAQINYTADVAANMPPHTYTTAVASSDLPGERDRTPQRSSSDYARSTCTCHSQLRPACAARPRTRSSPPCRQLPFLRLRPARCTTFMLGGSSSTRSPRQAPSWSGTWLGSALGRAFFLSVPTCGLARSSLSMRRYLSCAQSCKSVSRWLGPLRAPPSPSNLLLRTPYFRLAGDLTLCSKCPGNGISPRLRNFRSPCDSRRTSDHPPPRLSLLMMTPRAALSATFSRGSRWPARSSCGTLSAQAALPFARRPSLPFGPCRACRKPLAIRNSRHASNAL